MIPKYEVDIVSVSYPEVFPSFIITKSSMNHNSFQEVGIFSITMMNFRYAFVRSQSFPTVIAKPKRQGESPRLSIGFHEGQFGNWTVLRNSCASKKYKLKIPESNKTMRKSIDAACLVVLAMYFCYDQWSLACQRKQIRVCPSVPQSSLLHPVFSGGRPVNQRKQNMLSIETSKPSGQGPAGFEGGAGGAFFLTGWQ